MNQKEKSLQTQLKIKKAALDLFTQRGYKETKMSDIVSSSGLSKGAVYHHFRSKEEILEQVITEETEALNQKMATLAEQNSQSAKQRLLSLIDELINHQMLQKLTRINWAEKVPFGLLFTLRNTVNKLAPFVGEMIEQGNKNGEFSCPYPFETASSFVILLDVWLDPTIADSSNESISQKIDYLAYFLTSQQLPLLSDEKCWELKKRVLRNQNKK
ncbi:TetR/AcrR family transcriptional regulator [Streptococcus dentiloxodontae]